MSHYSEVFSTYVNEKGVSVSALAKRSGVERTSIYKMMNGERHPADVSVAEKLGRALLLSPTEMSRLLGACRIDEMGEAVYRSRQSVLDFFSNFSPAHVEATSILTPDTPLPLNGNGAAYGSLAVNNLVRAVLSVEGLRPDGRIRVLAQPDYRFLIAALELLGVNNPALTIEHVVCLENGQKEENGLYNFDCVTKLISLLASGCNYQPRYFYDHVDSHFSETSVLPFFVLTRTHVVALSYDQTMAVVSDDAGTLELYARVFDELRGKSEPLAYSFPDQLSFVGYWNDAKQRLVHLDYSFSYQPCLLPLSSGELVRKYVNRDVVQTDAEVEMIEEYMCGRRESNWHGKIKRFFFSEASIDDFLRDGRILEIPNEFYHPLDVPDRYKILRRLCEELEADRYHAAIIKPEVLTLSPSLSCGVYGNCAFMDIVGLAQSFETFVIKEQSVVSTLKDFFEYLEPGRMVLSREQTLALLKQKLANAPPIAEA